jgi:hypothetical protein
MIGPTPAGFLFDVGRRPVGSANPHALQGRDLPNGARPNEVLHTRRGSGMLCAGWRGQMAKEASPNYSVVKQERGWCWCSYAVQEIRGRGGLV